MAVTANSSERLARELDRIGQPEMAAKARANQYHDFLSDSATPMMDLAHELALIGPRSASAAELRKRCIDGEFDAPDDEAEEWASSDEAKDLFGELAGRSASKDR